MGKSIFKDGVLENKKVTVKRYNSIEHGDISKISSIVLHRTAGSKASSSLNAYAAGQKTGAHFLIGEKGVIYQTASLEKQCWHVGKLYSRCVNERSCPADELKTINAILHEKGVSFSSRTTNLSRHEVKKSYPLRYPSNKDSIGVEVVGRFNVVSSTFEKPSNSQFISMKWLVSELISHFSLELKKDVYAHGVIARKKEAEGAQLLEYLLKGAVTS